VHEPSDGSRVLKKARNLCRTDPRPVRPVSSQSNENMEESRAIVMKDRRITTRLLVERPGVDRKAARQILKRDLRKKICSKFVLQSFAAEQR
jgi:hypothetical protein